MKSGPIIIVEDDVDDKELLENVFHELKIQNNLIFFRKSEEAITYLRTTSEQPFLIFSDVNLPVENGIEFKRRIDADKQLRKKSIPFVFYTTSADKRTIDTAYTELMVQGFFQKENRYEEIKKCIDLIVQYWQMCRHPNST